MKLINVLMVSMAKLFGLTILSCSILSTALAQSADTAAILPPIQLLLDEEGSVPSGAVNAVINPSRTDCASPCTVVFSADGTTAVGLDSHGIWTQLAYYWDFDTDETDTHGALYEQTYTYVAGDTSHEKGHVPMVTKTFLCETGTCTYNVGMRAQNTAGEFDDAFVTITVKSEADQWSAANTICVSNTLTLADNWGSFDKPCPVGAARQATFPFPDQFDGKLILVKRGDVFDEDDIFPTQFGETRFAIQNGQSNYKVGNFGDAADPFPDLQAMVYSGVTGYQTSNNVVTSIGRLPNNANVAANGWSNNGYFEGLRMGGFNFPETFSHIGLHDIDMDMETSDITHRGRVAFSGGTRCTDHPNDLDCANVPFPKGGYISKVKAVGGTDAETNSGAVLNVAGVGCAMVNFTGIVDSSFRKAGEHNVRIMGWWRLNIMRSAFLGQHYSSGKQKLTIRGCFDADLDAGVWATRNDLPASWRADPEGRTRADFYLYNNTDEYIHLNRYQVINGNQLGNANVMGTSVGGTQYQTNAVAGDQPVFQDIVLTKNTFTNEADRTSGSNIGLSAHYAMCVDNTYSTASIGCFPSNLETVFPGSFREPTPITPPLKPGSL